MTHFTELVSQLTTEVTQVKQQHRDRPRSRSPDAALEKLPHKTWRVRFATVPAVQPGDTVLKEPLHKTRRVRFSLPPRS
ncbi:hypothetical protein E2C01_031095 [Portunus trituberculatus]|uniref:Uncharacterized protein n=1 Tax=Portunus trituberculatus TaxID=210409 RepID=A0A5B7EX65_PORTR|nr:hypothetical protein [Portunus trituberculatus]